MKAFKRVLVGIDFSPACDSALVEAERVARWDDAELLAVNVLEDRFASLLMRGFIENADEEFGEKMTKHLDEHLEKILGENRVAKPCFIIGNAVFRLAQKVREWNADLVVLGSGSQPGHIGDVASRVLRGIDRDVLLVRERSRSPFRHIVACVDFSENSLVAAAEALRIARQDGARVEFLHVHEPMSEFLERKSFFTAIIPELRVEEPEGSESAVLEELEAFTGPTRKGAGEIETSTVLLNRLDYKEAIIDYLNESGADLAVLGTHGKSASDASLAPGSTAERVINRAPCSVMAVRSC